MSLPSTAKPLIAYKNDTPHSRLYIQPVFKQKKNKRIVTLFSNLNPFAWFNEFSNIEVTLEEFAASKK